MNDTNASDTPLGTIPDRVRRGAELLDARRPGWAGELALDRLAMSSCDRCILGQLYGEYFSGMRELAAPLPCTVRLSAAEHGFTLPNDEQDPDPEMDLAPVWARFRELADAWRSEVKART